MQRVPRTQSLEFTETRVRSNSGPAPKPVTELNLAPIVGAQKRRILALQSQLDQARKHSVQSNASLQKEVAYKGKVRDEFRQLHAELHGQQQALVKARREVRRLVGKRSEERMAYEKLLAEHHVLQKQLGLPLKKAEVPAGAKTQSPSPQSDQTASPKAPAFQTVGKKRRNRRRKN